MNRMNNDFENSRLWAKDRCMSSALQCFSFACFTLEHVKEINKKIINLDRARREQPELLGARHAKKIGKFSMVTLGPLMELIHPFINKCQQLNRDFFGYHVYWDFHLESCAYNVYEAPDGEYGWHIDSNRNDTKLDLKLTCLLNLSEEPYEGGKLSLVNNDTDELTFTSGMGIIFTSLVAHRVSPVTKGKRITLTYWGGGPSWK